MPHGTRAAGVSPHDRTRRLFAELATVTGAEQRAEALEIGAGTGQAPRGLLTHGWRVVALEPGRELAAVAHRVLAPHSGLRPGSVSGTARAKGSDRALHHTRVRGLAEAADQRWADGRRRASRPTTTAATPRR